MEIFKNGISAHRGDSEKFPENTVEAFLAGISAGADWLELDIRYTADRQLVVIHDAVTGRVADKDLIVAETSLAELKKLDFAFQFRKRNPGTPVSRIPTLREVLIAAGGKDDVGISIQPKNTGAEGKKAVEETISLAKELGMLEFIGFNDGQLDLMRLVKEKNPKIPVFYDIFSPNLEHLKEALKYGFESLICFKDNITQEWVDAVHSTNIIPGAWTVDSADEFKKLYQMGVKRFYTDCPEKMLKILKRL
jgi:glycerophosphoryl diester phosphodiesterase